MNTRDGAFMKNSDLAEKICINLLNKATRVYFGGILGASQSAMAHLLKQRGKLVAGCDQRARSADAEAMRAAGIPIDPERQPQLYAGDLVVYSLALGDDSPLFREARALELHCISRAQLLGALMAAYPRRVVVSGSHGKSTTVGMLARILTVAGVDPTILGGAPLSIGGAHYRIGEQSLILTEGCEYKDSFLSLSPTLGILTNLEFDHPDYFPNMAALERSFIAFMRKCEQVCVNIGCHNLSKLCPKGAYTFGFTPKATLFAQVREGGLVLWEHGEKLGEISLHIGGAYQRENALAAVAGARCLGIDFTSIQNGLASFHGIGRRLEYVGNYHGARLYIDYAHHPTQIVAAREALMGAGKLWCVYQPHTYTRTNALWDWFVAALGESEHTILIDIYPAREAPIPAITSERLADAAGIKYTPTLAEAKAYLDSHVQVGDIVVLMGAGDIAEGARLFLEG